MKKDRIIAKYLNYLDTAERAPNWVYKFTEAASVDKEDFYNQFEDISHLERQIWMQPLSSTLRVLSEDPGYPDYSAREQLLAFYFTLMENLNDQDRAFRLILNRSLIPSTTPAPLKDFKPRFLEYAREIVQKAINTHEIERRPLITSYYNDALWLQCLFLIRFWKNDRSTSHTATDEAVERSVNLIFDLIGYTPIDSALGFTRFIYRNKKLLF